MQGVVGEGYTRVLNGEAHTLPNDGSFYGNPEDYSLPHYFPNDSQATHKVLLLLNSDSQLRVLGTSGCINAPVQGPESMHHRVMSAIQVHSRPFQTPQGFFCS